MTTSLKSDNDYFSYIRNKAEEGEAWAQKALGDMYYFSLNAPSKRRDVKHNAKQFVEAANWYRKAAEQNDPGGQFALGGLYYYGEGVKKDFSLAAEWYQKAAENEKHEIAEAQYNLGRLYYFGMGVSLDKAEAFKWYEKAAQNKHKNYREAWYLLGLMYLKGEGVKSGLGEALFYFMLAWRKNNMIEAKSKIDEINREGKLSSIKRQISHEIMEKFLAEYKDRTPQKIGGQIAVVPPPAKPLTPDEIFERVWPSVVVIVDNKGYGSGVIIQPNIVATNFHVVENSKNNRVLVHKPANNLGIGYYPYSAEWRDGRADLDFCLLDVDELWGKPVSVREYNTLKVGEPVYALGAPEGKILSFTSGIISQKRPAKKEIQIDAAMSHGSSGGGLFDAGGNLIGLPTRGEIGRDVEEDKKRFVSGIYYAVAADCVLEF